MLNGSQILSEDVYNTMNEDRVITTKELQNKLEVLGYYMSVPNLSKLVNDGVFQPVVGDNGRFEWNKAQTRRVVQYCVLQSLAQYKTINDIVRFIDHADTEELNTVIDILNKRGFVQPSKLFAPQIIAAKQNDNRKEAQRWI